MSSGNLLFKIFGRSPLGPLQTHMETVYKAVEHLKLFFESTLTNDWDKAFEIYNQISTQEREADELKKTVRLSLPQGFFLPVPRTDLLEMLVRQDSIANRAKDIAGITIGRKITFPSSMQKDFMIYLERSIQASFQAHQAIQELDNLLETGFSGREVDLVVSMIEKLDVIEHETDTMQIDLRQKLFSIEKDLNAVDVMFLYKLLDWTGDLADRAQKVGGQLEVIIAR